MSYPVIAKWLTDQGYPTKAEEVKNAKRASLIAGVVPRTQEVVALLKILAQEHPGLDVEKFFANPLLE